MVLADQLVPLMCWYVGLGLPPTAVAVPQSLIDLVNRAKAPPGLFHLLDGRVGDSIELPRAARALEIRHAEMQAANLVIWQVQLEGDAPPARRPRARSVSVTFGFPLRAPASPTSCLRPPPDRPPTATSPGCWSRRCWSALNAPPGRLLRPTRCISPGAAPPVILRALPLLAALALGCTPPSARRSHARPPRPSAVPAAPVAPPPVAVSPTFALMPSLGLSPGVLPARWW
nr:hypothetical protein [Deltaproteobacteria bacterium]